MVAEEEEEEEEEECNYDVITRAPMTSQKSHSFIVLAMCQVSISSFVQFQSFRFENMAAKPRDLRRHYYH